MSTRLFVVLNQSGSRSISGRDLTIDASWEGGSGPQTSNSSGTSQCFDLIDEDGPKPAVGRAGDGNFVTWVCDVDEDRLSPRSSPFTKMTDYCLGLCQVWGSNHDASNQIDEFRIMGSVFAGIQCTRSEESPQRFLRMRLEGDMWAYV